MRDYSDEFDVPKHAPQAVAPVKSDTPPDPMIQKADANDGDKAAKPETFPNDLATCLRLLTNLDNDRDDSGSPVKLGSPAQQRARANRLARLRRHVFEMQQGPTTTPVTAQEQAAFQADQQAARTRQGTRLKELCAKHPSLAAAARSTKSSSTATHHAH